MKDSKQVIDQVTREISPSPNDSPTAAGPTNERGRPAPELVDAINQIFSLFSINFHNQYYAAFKDANTEIQAKRLWLESLRHMEPSVLLQAAKSVITRCEYLPTLHTMLEHCDKVRGEALPEAHSAYVEACRAPSPKAAAQWSHPVVYHAGKNCDWYFLATSTEAAAFPVFRRIYGELCERVRAGEELPAPDHLALPEESETKLSATENREKLAQLRRQLDL